MSVSCEIFQGSCIKNSRPLIHNLPIYRFIKVVSYLHKQLREYLSVLKIHSIQLNEFKASAETMKFFHEMMMDLILPRKNCRRQHGAYVIAEGDYQMGH